jgi:hypothetical protein
LETPPLNLNVAMARRSWSALPGVKPAHFDRDPHRLFLKQRHAERLASTFSSSGFGKTVGS